VVLSTTTSSLDRTCSRSCSRSRVNERFRSEERFFFCCPFVFRQKFLNRKVSLFYSRVGTPVCVLLRYKYDDTKTVPKAVAGKKRESEVMCRKPSIKCSITRRRTRLRVFRRLRVASSPDGLWLIFSPLLARLRCFVAGA
jgi:hypothetical protein